MPLSPSAASRCLPGLCSSAAPTSETISLQAADHAKLPLMNERAVRKEPVGLRQSMASPGFAQQLSHKLSTTFGNPTIVHRPTLCTRPSFAFLDGDGGPINRTNNHYNSPQDSTAPSSITYSGSASVGGYSTSKTSLDSNVASKRTTPQHEDVGRSSEARFASTAIARENSLTPIQEAPQHIPTILTVEKTANAKIFFESHYDPLLAGKLTSRSLRRRDLESRLEAQATPEEERCLERWTWAIGESAHLRLVRALKSRTNRSTMISGVAVAGYEVIRILGKGSFGVVRLVKEKEHDSGPAQVWMEPTQGNLTDPMASLSESGKSRSSNSKLAQRSVFNTGGREVYAMKVIRKSDMLRNCQEGHLRAERDFLVAAEKSRWVVPLIASFQDRTNLYLVMEYMVGGDFLGLLFRRNILKERHTRWYVAEMILCVEETHRRKWLHRDIKPDNFLISASGHLKISDFGLAFDGHWSHDQHFFKNHRKSLMEKLEIEVKGDREDQEEDATKAPRSNLANILTGRSRTSNEHAQLDGPCEDESILQWRNREGKRRMAASVVGTSQYMAPEVIRGGPYDGRCDWWSIGIILYEVSTQISSDLSSSVLLHDSVSMGIRHSCAKIEMTPKHAFWSVNPVVAECHPESF